MSNESNETIALGPAETLAFIELAFSRMMTSARSVGDRVADAPDLPEANSIYQLLVHCMALTRWWLGHELAGADADRDRDSEFTATGTLPDLQAQVDEFRADLPGLVAAAHAAPLVDSEGGLPSGGEQHWPMTNAGIILHVIEELFQHTGHADLTADLLRR